MDNLTEYFNRMDKIHLLALIAFVLLIDSEKHDQQRRKRKKSLKKEFNAKASQDLGTYSWQIRIRHSP